MTGCGGGGGGEKTEHLSLSTDEISLEAVREVPSVWHETVALTLSDKVYTVAYGTGSGALPEWLHIEGDWIDEHTLEARFSFVHTNVPEGIYETVVTFYALDEDDNVLDQRDVTVTVTITETVAFPQASESRYVFGIYGHSTVTEAFQLEVLAAGERWQVSADVPWISLPSAIQEGSGTFQVVVDWSAVGSSGLHEGTIQLVNADDPAETDEFEVSLVLDAPGLAASSPLLGGHDGLNEDPKTITVQLNTGTNSYPWKITGIQYVIDAPDWLLFSKTEGTVGASNDSLTVDADRSVLAPEMYSAMLTFEVEVLNELFTGHANVHLAFEENRIYAVDNGVALYHLPSRSRVSADVKVLNSRDYLDVPWSAVSDQPWLTITPDGLTGGTLSVTADTAGLAADTVHVATVTIASSDPAINNQETVTVALWKGSTDATDLALNVPFERSVANPTFPFIHASVGGELRTYNIFTGALASTIDLPHEQSGDLAVSSDGLTIYVADADGPDVAAIELASGAVQETLQRTHDYKLGYLRVQGHPIIRGAGKLYLFGHGFSDARDFRATASFINWDTGGYSLNGNTIKYSAFFGGWLQFSSFGEGPPYPGEARTVGIAPDTVLALVGVTGPDEFRLHSGIPREIVWTVPALGVPNNALARQDGLLIAGSHVDDESADIQLLDADGNALGTLSSPAGALLEDEMSLTSDTSRLMTPTDSGVIGVLQLPD